MMINNVLDIRYGRNMQCSYKTPFRSDIPIKHALPAQRKQNKTKQNTNKISLQVWWINFHVMLLSYLRIRMLLFRNFDDVVLLVSLCTKFCINNVLDIRYGRNMQCSYKTPFRSDIPIKHAPPTQRKQNKTKQNTNKISLQVWWINFHVMLLSYLRTRMLLFKNFDDVILLFSLCTKFCICVLYKYMFYYIPCLIS